MIKLNSHLSDDVIATLIHEKKNKYKLLAHYGFQGLDKNSMILADYEPPLH